MGQSAIPEIFPSKVYSYQWENSFRDKTWENVHFPTFKEKDFHDFQNSKSDKQLANFILLCHDDIYSKQKTALGKNSLGSPLFH